MLLGRVIRSNVKFLCLFKHDDMKTYREGRYSYWVLDEVRGYL